MKTDDFETKLQRQSPRQIPAAWREVILANANRQMCHAETEYSIPPWRLVLNRFPVAWGALAMLWAVLLAVNLMLAAPHSRTTTHTVFAARAEPLAVWNLQRAELSLLTDLPNSTTARPSAEPARPRSDRRRSERIGEFPTRQVANLAA